MEIAILGGAGQMGKWFALYFYSRGHKVIISDINVDKAKAVAKETKVECAENNIKAVKNVDLILVSTPMQIIPKVVNEIVSYAKKGAIIAEISSFKTHLTGNLSEIAKLGLIPLSIHPLFGPGARHLTGKKILAIPIFDSEKETKIVKKLFPEAEVIIVNAKVHDKIMALTLSLPHFINIAFASTLSDEDVEKIKKFEGPTFKLQSILAESIITENPILQASIQFQNEYAFQYINKFLVKAKKMENLILNNKVEKFTMLCDDVRKSLSKKVDLKNSYKMMYNFFEKK